MDQDGRAVAIIAQPLEAEVFLDGVWWPGAVLGWRHDESGGCEARVRIDVAGGARLIGVDLAAVRLPEPAGAPAAESEPPAETVVMSRAELRERLGGALSGRTAGRAAGRRRHASDLTAELPVVRSVETDGFAGHHRASASIGRHRAPDAPAFDAVATEAIPIKVVPIEGVPIEGVPTNDIAIGSPAAEPDPALLTRPIRLDDVAAWSWGSSSAAAS